MNEELEWTKIDKNSPIWGGSGCDYYDLTLEVQSYWIGFYKEKLNLISEGGLVTTKEKGLDVEEHNNIMKEFEDSYTVNTQFKTEEYFRLLWENIKNIGFKKEDSEHCIQLCDTLISEEVDWWEDPKRNLRKYGALKVPSLVEYYSWYVIWMLCKYDKLITHPLYIYASKRQKALKLNLPQKTPRIALKLNMNVYQLGDLYQGLIQFGVFATKHQIGQFLSAVNGSEHTSIIEPMKFKDDKVLALVIMFLRDNLFIDGANPQYLKWELFFGINKTYARKLVSDYGKLVKQGADAKTHRTLPEEYDKIKSLFDSIVKRG